MHVNILFVKIGRGNMEKLIRIITSMTVFAILLVLVSIGVVYPTDDVELNISGNQAIIQFIIMIVYLVYNAFVGDELCKILVTAEDIKSAITSDIRTYVERGWIILVGMSLVSVFYFLGIENTSWLAYFGNAILFFISWLVVKGGRILLNFAKQEERKIS